MLALAVSNDFAVASSLDDEIAAYDRGDYATALKLMMPLAAQGDAVAQAIVGWMYQNGWGVPKDYGEAVKWYRPAAAQGNALAQNNLGGMYAYGRGVRQDDVLSYMRLSVGKTNPKNFVSKMTSAQIAQAQKMAKRCVEFRL